MSPDRQRIVIAEACGIVSCDQHGPLYHTKEGVVRDCPDYLNDLNACHEMEQGLNSDERWRQYTCWLAKIHIGDLRPKAAGNHYHVATSILLSSPASIRAEAFLRTLGLWEETP